MDNMMNPTVENNLIGMKFGPISVHAVIILINGEDQNGRGLSTNESIKNGILQLMLDGIPGFLLHCWGSPTKEFGLLKIERFPFVQNILKSPFQKKKYPKIFQENTSEFFRKIGHIIDNVINLILYIN